MVQSRRVLTSTFVVDCNKCFSESLARLLSGVCRTNRATSLEDLAWKKITELYCKMDGMIDERVDGRANL